MKEEKKAVATATKNETANANNSAAKTTTPSTAASVKQAEPAKTEAPKAEAKPAETKPAATAAPKAETKTAAPAATTAEPAKTDTPKAEPKTEKPAAPQQAEPAPKEDPAAKVAAFAAALNDKRETIEEMQKRLNEELQRLNHKKEVADKRSVFLTCSGKIDEYLKQLQQESEFNTNICRLTFEILEKNQYGREEFHDLMTVSNTAIVTKFCNALKDEIAAKVAELENELLTA